MSRDIQSLLRNPDKGVERAYGVLPKLFRNILADLKVDNSQFNLLMSNYLNNPRNGFSHDPKKRSSERSNLMKEIVRSSMTFKVFLKCIKFLSPLEAKLTITLKFRDHTTIHDFNLGRVSDIAFDELIKRELDNDTAGDDEDDDGNDYDRDWINISILTPYTDYTNLRVGVVSIGCEMLWLFILVLWGVVLWLVQSVN